MIKSSEHLICFDLDGVLISSLVIVNKIFYDIIERELGLPVDDYRGKKKPMSLSAEERITTLWTDDIRKRGITEEQILNALQTFRDKKMAAEIPLLPHAKEAVEFMAENFENIACVSSNPDYLIDETLQRLDLRQYFSKITGLDHIQFCKPDPEIYASTAEYFAIEPGKCLVFEDSTHGVNSAKGAGMNVIAVATGLEEVEDLEKTQANKVLKDLSELNLELVQEIL